MEDLLFSMLPCALTQPYYTSTKGRGLLRKLMKPAQAFAWRSLERTIIKQFHLEGPLIPEQPLKSDLLLSGQVVESTWYELVERSMLASNTRKAASKRRSRFVGGWWRRKSKPRSGRGSAAGSERLSITTEQPEAAYGSSHADNAESGAAWPASSAFMLSGMGSSSAKGQRGSMLADAIIAERGPQSGGGQMGYESPRGSPSHPQGGAGSGGEPPGSPRTFNAAAAGAPMSPRSPRPGGPSSMAYADDAFEGPAGTSSGDYGATWAQRRQMALQQRAQRGRKSNMSMDGNACVSIRPVRGEVAQFTQQGVLLADGQHLPADLVLYCTGYTKSYDFLDGGVKVGAAERNLACWCAKAHATALPGAT